MCGGKRVGDKGFYFEPTIFEVEDNHAKIAQEEIFGPVQCVFKWKDMNKVRDQWGTHHGSDTSPVTVHVQECGHASVSDGPETTMLLYRAMPWQCRHCQPKVSRHC